MTPVGFVPESEKTSNVSWLSFEQDGAAAFKLSERSPQPPALSARDLLGGRTQILNVRRMKKIDHHLMESDKDSASKSILETKNWLDCNGYLDYPTARENDWNAYNECDIDGVGNCSIFIQFLL